jgi:hypothetical protein
MLRRHAQSKLVALAEHALAMLWAITALFAAIFSPWALAPLLAAATMLALCRGGTPRRLQASPTLVATTGFAQVIPSE